MGFGQGAQAGARACEVRTGGGGQLLPLLLGRALWGECRGWGAECLTALGQLAAGAVRHILCAYGYVYVPMAMSICLWLWLCACVCRTHMRWAWSCREQARVGAEGGQPHQLLVQPEGANQAAWGPVPPWVMGPVPPWVMVLAPCAVHPQTHPRSAGSGLLAARPPAAAHAATLPARHPPAAAPRRASSAGGTAGSMAEC